MAGTTLSSIAAIHIRTTLSVTAQLPRKRAYRGALSRNNASRSPPLELFKLRSVVFNLNAILFVGHGC
jgi:hypothetical protein